MIDSHQHLWKYTDEEFGWIPPGSPIARDFLTADLEAEARTAGVIGTVVVQARQTLEESDWLLSLSESSGLIRGVVGWVPLIDTNVAEPLGRLAAHDKFKGVRHILQGESDEYFLRDDFHRGLAQLPDLDLRYDLLLLQRQIPAAIQLVDRQPDLGIVIDHIAKPEIHNGRIDPTWKAGMAELAKRENILGVKVSGMVTEVLDPEIDEATLRAYFDITLELFGADRVLFGTDWPVCLLRIESYQKCTDMAMRFVSRLSEEEQFAILGANAALIYDL